MDEQLARGALLDVRLAIAQVFERERVARTETVLFSEEPHQTVEHPDGYTFAYPGVAYGIDVERGVVSENTDVPDVDARRFFDLHGRDLYAERDRLRGLVDRLGRRREP